MIRKLAKNDVGKVLISVILGLGISALFRKVCHDRDCLVIEGPPIKEVEKHIFQNAVVKVTAYRGVSSEYWEPS